MACWQKTKAGVDLSTCEQAASSSYSGWRTPSGATASLCACRARFSIFQKTDEAPGPRARHCHCRRLMTGHNERQSLVHILRTNYPCLPIPDYFAASVRIMPTHSVGSETQSGGGQVVAAFNVGLAPALNPELMFDLDELVRQARAHNTRNATSWPLWCSPPGHKFSITLYFSSLTNSRLAGSLPVSSRAVLLHGRPGPIRELQAPKVSLPFPQWRKQLVRILCRSRRC